MMVTPGNYWMNCAGGSLVGSADLASVNIALTGVETIEAGFQCTLDTLLKFSDFKDVTI